MKPNRRSRLGILMSLSVVLSLVPLWAKGDAGRLLRPFALNSDPVRGL